MWLRTEKMTQPKIDPWHPERRNYLILNHTDLDPFVPILKNFRFTNIRNMGWFGREISWFNRIWVIFFVNVTVIFNSLQKMGRCKFSITKWPWKIWGLVNLDRIGFETSMFCRLPTKTKLVHYQSKKIMNFCENSACLIAIYQWIIFGSTNIFLTRPLLSMSDLWFLCPLFLVFVLLFQDLNLLLGSGFKKKITLTLGKGSNLTDILFKWVVETTT